MTRRQIAAYLREHGVPVGDSTLDKLCMPTVNEGPPVAAWWGRRPLYDPEEALAWAESRMRPAQTTTISPQEIGPKHPHRNRLKKALSAAEGDA